MRKFYSCVSLLLVFCLCMFCGCAEKNPDEKNPDENPAYSAEMWCYNQAVERIKSLPYTYVSSIVSYTVDEMVLTEDYLKYVHDDETAKCYYFNFIGSGSDLDIEIDGNNALLESYCVIVYRENKSKKIYKDDIALLSGKCRRKNYDGTSSYNWVGLGSFGTRTYICPVCSESQKLNWGEWIDKYSEGEWYSHQIDYYDEYCPKCRWRYERKMISSSEEEYEKELQNAKDNYAKGLDVNGFPIKTES